MNLITSTGMFIEHCCDVVNTIANGTVFGKLSIAAGAIAASYIIPIQSLLLVCATLTVVDMCYGIAVARKQKLKITSDKNWKGTILKILHETLILCLVHSVEHAILGPGCTRILTGGATALLSLTEIWSILENLNTLYPTGPWKILGAFLKHKGEEYTGMEININENEKRDTKVAKKSQKGRS